tara:strand:- start:798 stop:1193 length:396 start_codon:yes stop_codon:yes gene_type:complete
MSNDAVSEIAAPNFNSDQVADHYLRIGSQIGLWKSEKIFSKTGWILDLSCGAGRIAFGFEKLGFQNIDAAYCSHPLPEVSGRILLNSISRVHFHHADARNLFWEDRLFDGVKFGFNGLFMIPRKDDRLEGC